MGDDFINNRKKSYKRQHDKAHAEEYKQSSLSMMADEQVSHSYRFQSPSINPEVGTEVILVDVPGKDKIRVMQGTIPIGEVDLQGSEKLREIFSENESLGGFLPAQVSAEKDLLGYAKVKITH